jgi:hypothetical protein
MAQRGGGVPDCRQGDAAAGLAASPTTAGRSKPGRQSVVLVPATARKTNIVPDSALKAAAKARLDAVIAGAQLTSHWFDGKSQNRYAADMEGARQRSLS